MAIIITNDFSRQDECYSLKLSSFSFPYIMFLGNKILVIDKILDNTYS